MKELRRRKKYYKKNQGDTSHLLAILIAVAGI